AQGTVGAADIFKASRPSSARVSHTAILDIPGGQACTLQRVTEMAGVSQVILGAPVAAMDKEDQRMRPFAGRQPNIHELIRIRAVGEPKVRPRRLLGQDVFTLHGSAKYRTENIYHGGTGERAGDQRFAQNNVSATESRRLCPCLADVRC